MFQKTETDSPLHHKSFPLAFCSLLIFGLCMSFFVPADPHPLVRTVSVSSGRAVPAPGVTNDKWRKEISVVSSFWWKAQLRKARILLMSDGVVVLILIMFSTFFRFSDLQRSNSLHLQFGKENMATAALKQRRKKCGEKCLLLALALMP